TGVDVGDERFAVHEPLLQPRAVTVDEDAGQHQVRQVGVELADRVGHAVSDGERGQRGVRVDVRVAQFARRTRFGERGPLRTRARGYVAEVLLDQLARVVDLDVPCHGQHRV